MVTGTSLGLNSYLTIFKREHESLTYKNTSTVSKYRQEEKLFFSEILQDFTIIQYKHSGKLTMFN